MGSVNSTNADAKEAETSSQPEHLEAKNQGKGVKRSQDKDIDPAQQSVSRSSETPEGLEQYMNDVQIGQTISSPGKGKFSFLNFFSVTSSAVKEIGKRENGKWRKASWFQDQGRKEFSSAWNGLRKTHSKMFEVS